MQYFLGDNNNSYIKAYPTVSLIGGRIKDDYNVVVMNRNHRVKGQILDILSVPKAKLWLSIIGTQPR